MSPPEPVSYAWFPCPSCVGPNAHSYRNLRERFSDSRHKVDRSRPQGNAPALEFVHYGVPQIKDDGCNHFLYRINASKGCPRTWCCFGCGASFTHAGTPSPQSSAENWTQLVAPIRFPSHSTDKNRFLLGVTRRIPGLRGDSPKVTAALSCRLYLCFDPACSWPRRRKSYDSRADRRQNRQGSL